MEIPHRSAKRLARGAVVTVCLLIASACSYDGAWDVIRELQGVFAPDQDTAWFDPAFQHRHYLVFDNRAATEDLVNFPVLVTLTPDRVDYSTMLVNGADLRFTDSDGVTVLDHEINSWSYGGTSTIWVRVPRLREESRRECIWVYYGNSAAGSAENATGVWDSGFRGVWHLGDLADATANDNDGSVVSPGPAIAAGVIGNGRDFNGGATSYINVGNGPSLQITGNLTLEAWARRRSTGYKCIVGKYDYVLADRSYMLGFDYFGTIFQEQGPCAVVSQSGNLEPGGLVQHAPAEELDTWQHVAAVFGSNHLRLYVNGIRVAETAPSFTSLHNNTEPVIIGACDNGSSLRFDGVLDEVRISAAARSDSWIRAQYLSMTDRLITYGPRQTR